ncbi:hypothetical protein [Microbacterium sp.]|uniref:hypothetical protein n=1 Tax=Microbacterium sp. TaxID=51671 RepID=UPI0028A64C26|nr:hypothetical protein [Microbacterium sp.]
MGATPDAGSDADDRDARARRRTWVIGGALLVVSALVVVPRALLYQAGIIGPSPGWVHYVGDWLWAIGVLILVIGLGRAGSITGRRPFSTVVVILQVIVASPAASLWLSTLVLDDPQNLHAQEDSWSAIFLPYYVTVFVLTFIAALSIGLARAVPEPWCWAPSGALLVAIAFGSVGLGGVHGLAGFTVVYLPAITTALLGVLAIVLGIRAVGQREAPPETTRPLPDSREGYR